MIVLFRLRFFSEINDSTIKVIISSSTDEIITAIFSDLSGKLLLNGSYWFRVHLCLYVLRSAVDPYSLCSMLISNKFSEEPFSGGRPLTCAKAGRDLNSVDQSVLRNYAPLENHTELCFNPFSASS